MEIELKFIDDYFQKQLPESERIAFEKKIESDAEFAELVAFYINSKAILQEKNLENKYAEWNSQPKAISKKFNPKIVVGLAACLLVFFGIWFFNIQNEPQEYSAYATEFIKTDLATLPIKMDAHADSLELGKKYYNEKNYTAAATIFEKIPNIAVLEYRGLIALQLGQYEQAENYFKRLATAPDLINNKGKFYLALTLAKKGDSKSAEAIFNEVLTKNLAGKSIVESWKK